VLTHSIVIALPPRCGMPHGESCGPDSLRQEGHTLCEGRWKRVKHNERNTAFFQTLMVQTWP
jgi:hypothetical protein